MSAIPLLLAASLAVASAATPDYFIRGRKQNLVYLPGAGDQQQAVIFLPGDGGWRGFAVAMAQTVQSWGYDVYGLDTKRYLESFTDGAAPLTSAELAGDMHAVANYVARQGARKVVLLGWSQGAGMGVLAASSSDPMQIKGLITLGLPERAVLGWDWKATMASLARREPDQPHFDVAPLMDNVRSTPLFMIHATDDEYTPPATARRLFARVPALKHFVEIKGANHRFDGQRDRFFIVLKEGLEWTFQNAH